MMTDELITVEEAANILKVRRETIRKYIKNGDLNAHSLPGGDYRIPESELKRLLDRSGRK
jgi:excisionase family DNA binding protein